MNTAKERIKSRKGKNLIATATSHQNRLKFHVETALQESHAKAANRFLEWVQMLIPEEKYRIFLHLFQYPVLTNELCDSIFTELRRVFNGRNRAASYQFEDSKFRDDWEWYKSDILHLNSVMQNECFERVKHGINSLVVVDFPRTQQGALPEPYFYFVDIENVLSFDYDRVENVFLWVAFRQDEQTVVYIDTEKYMVFNETEKGELVQEHEASHGLEMCPVRFMWTDSISSDKPEIKKSPISKHLAKLDWLLMFETSKHHLDLYAPYPIYSVYEQDCDFVNSEKGVYCERGFLKKDTGEYLFDGHGLAKCPICEKNSPVGVGAVIEVPAPEDKVDMKNPVGITTVDNNSLRYNQEEVERLKNDIYYKAVGYGGELYREAVNEKQVDAGFESKHSVLRNLKTNFEALETWLTEVICKIRYGRVYLQSNVSYGTEFYVSSINELYDQYKQAKENGMGDIVLDGIMDKIIETEYQNNPLEAQRVLILKHLEPYRHLSIKEALEYHQNGIFKDTVNLAIKINFSNFIMRFERENTNIIEFASKIEFDKKINIIHEKLIEYATG